MNVYCNLHTVIKNPWAHILVQVTIYRRFLIGRDDNLDHSEAYEISWLVREYATWTFVRRVQIINGLAENIIFDN